MSVRRRLGRGVGLLAFVISGCTSAAGDPVPVTPPHSDPAAASDPHPHWGYAGADGPQHWGDLGNDYAECGDGRFQSPVDLPEFALSGDPGVEAAYEAGPLVVVNNGHTVQIRAAGQGSLVLADRAFSLAQVHVHSPSEHAVDGQRFEMEIHFVHEDAQGNYAVIGVFVEEGAEGETRELWTHLPTKVGSEKRFEDIEFDPSTLLPEERSHYEYAGSLTTPPCTERVTWEVMAKPIQLSRSQLDSFQDLYQANARPLQLTHDWCLSPIGAHPVSGE